MTTLLKTITGTENVFINIYAALMLTIILISSTALICNLLAGNLTFHFGY